MNVTEKKEFNSKLKSLVIPMAFQQLMTALVGVSDAVMHGFLSQDALSATSLAGQVQFIYTLFLSDGIPHRQKCRAAHIKQLECN